MSEISKSSGKVKFFNKSKGFGFIIPEEGKDIFFHVKDMKDKNDEPQENDLVEYVVEETKRGLAAKEVERV